MRVTTIVRGHSVYTENGQDWYYDDGQAYSGDGCDRPCTKCGVQSKATDPDPCLGILCAAEGKPAVVAACCGHGVRFGKRGTNEYVFLADGQRFDSVEEWRKFNGS